MQLTTSGALWNGTNATETSATPRPNDPHWSQLSTVQVAVLSVSVFFLILLMVDYVVKRRDTQGCRFDTCHRGRADMEWRPQYSSRQTLVGSTCPDHAGDSSAQVGAPFYISLPGVSGFPGVSAPPSRLPSYESVRKKDRQRQIHMMIANRFGLNATVAVEPPPTYEETIRQSVELPQHTLASSLDLSPHSTGPELDPPLDRGVVQV